MFSPRILLSTLFACIPVLLTGCSAPDSEATSATVIGNPITGEGLPNPAPNVTANWGELPAAGVGLDGRHRHRSDRWAHLGLRALRREQLWRRRAGQLRKQPRRSDLQVRPQHGEVLANFGGGIFVTPHGIHVDAAGNVWVTDFVETRRHQGPPGPQVQRPTANCS